MQTVEIEMGNANVSPKSRLLAVVVAMLSFGLIFTGGCSSPKLVDAFVTIVPGNTTVGTGATFTMYTSASPKGVTWAITKTTGCTGNACGTLSGATDTSVVYNAPVSMSGSAMSVTITATSKTDSSISASQTLTVYPVSVQISGPSNTTVVPLTAAVFNASVPGDLSNSGVTWTITGPTCVRHHRRLRIVSQIKHVAGDLRRAAGSSVRERYSHGDINLRARRECFDHVEHSEARHLLLLSLRAARRHCSRTW